MPLPVFIYIVLGLRELASVSATLSVRVCPYLSDSTFVHLRVRLYPYLSIFVWSFILRSFVFFSAEVGGVGVDFPKEVFD